MTTEFEVGLKRLDWFGLKSLIASLLTFKPVNFIFRRFARHCIPAKTAARYPISVQNVVYRLSGGEQIVLLDPARDEVARQIYWGQGRCISASDQIALDCVESLCQDAELFLDIGAYSGLFALVAAAAQSKLRVMAFEIVPENHLLVMRNIVENDFIGRIDARLCGLSNNPGSVTIAPSMQLDRMASSVSLGSEFSAGVRIPVDTLDNVISEIDGRIVMKIDVEGFENAVIQGGRRLFEDVKPDVICEFLPSSTDNRELDAYLTDLDYRFYQITENGLTRFDSIVPSKGGRDWLLTARKILPKDLPVT